MIIKTEKLINYKKIYDNNLNNFKECDYLYKKYKIPFSIAYIESFIEIDFSNKLRYVDRYIKITNKKHIIIFTHTFLQDAYNGILRLERNIIKNKEHIFNFGIYGIEKNIKNNLTSFEILEKVIKNKTTL